MQRKHITRIWMADFKMQKKGKKGKRKERKKMREKRSYRLEIICSLNRRAEEEKKYKRRRDEAFYKQDYIPAIEYASYLHRKQHHRKKCFNITPR